MYPSKYNVVPEGGQSALSSGLFTFYVLLSLLLQLKYVKMDLAPIRIFEQVGMTFEQAEHDLYFPDRQVPLRP